MEQVLERPFSTKISRRTSTSGRIDKIRVKMDHRFEYLDQSKKIRDILKAVLRLVSPRGTHSPNNAVGDEHQ